MSPPRRPEGDDRSAQREGAPVTAPASPARERAAQVRDALRPVCDPELDESVIELGFVTGVAVDADGGVELAFRLPTYWCAANFAFLMADDMRRAVAALPWVSRVTVRLADHMNDAQINAGLAGGLGFRETFGAEASDDLDALRRTFELKAFQRRQETLLRHLLDHGHAAPALLALSIAQLEALALDDEGAVLRGRYLARRGVVDAGALTPQATAFVDEHGAALDPATLAAYLRALRRVGVNAEFNGALCRGLFAERYPAGQARRVHFMRLAA